MPIIYKADETREVVFGHGDVAILPDLENGTPIISLWGAAIRHPLGTVKTIPQGVEPPVEIKLIFDKPESIDILITQLMQAKAQFSHKK